MRGKPIVCRLMIPDGNGGYREFTPDKEFSETCVRRMGDALADYFNQHIDVYQKVGAVVA